MAKRKAAKLGSGSQVRVKPGIQMPEFADLEISGWDGTVMETTGKGADQNVILEWSAACIARMPQGYKDHCDAQGLFHGMACLPLSSLEVEGTE